MPSTRTLNLTKFLQAGLAKGDRFEKNVPGLQECKNLRVQGDRLVQATPFTRLTTSDVVREGWPHPQVHKGNHSYYLSLPTTLYEVDSTWNLTRIVTRNPAVPKQGKDITIGGQWHFGEVGTCAVFWNGACIVVAKTDLDDGAKRFYVYDDFIAHTGCFMQGRGQVIMGRLENVAGGTPAWFTYIEDLAGDLTSDYNVAVDEDLQNMVWWSSIGGGDVTFLLEDTSGDGGYASRLLRGEAGFAHMPWSGEVLAVRQLGRNAVVYGANGIAALVPAAGPIPTYGVQELAPFGVLERSAVGGSTQMHVFLDPEGNVWTIGADLGLKKLGYKKWFRDTVENSPDVFTISYDPVDQEFYIGDSATCYVLGAQGMGRTEQVISSLEQTSALVVGSESVRAAISTYAGAESTYDDQSFEITTNPFDMGEKFVKSIEHVEVNAEHISNLQVSTYVRSSLDGEFVQTPWVIANPDGSVFQCVSGVEFKIGVKGDLSPLAEANSTIDGLELSWLGIDNRITRGI